MIELLFSKDWFQGVLESRERMGFDVAPARQLLDSHSGPCDSTLQARFLLSLSQLEHRKEWEFIEPDSWPEIVQQSNGPWQDPVPSAELIAQAAANIPAAFLASVCGCILGKPVEINPTFREIKESLSRTNNWPLKDYFTPDDLHAFGRPPHVSWHNTTKGNISYATHDDDINYTLLGLDLLERKGIQFQRKDVIHNWLDQLPLHTTFGPERLNLVAAGARSFKKKSASAGTGSSTGHDELPPPLPAPNEEYCGAMIRVDAYGLACPGRPALAAWLAWKDASCTHIKTGVYGAMWMAAAIALAPVCKSWRDLATNALNYVPRSSRFSQTLRDAIQLVDSSTSWETAADTLETRLSSYGHCWIYREAGMLVNTLKFATSVHEGFCMQVMQGADTDSYGARAGTLLGSFLGRDHFDSSWASPFQDRLKHSLALFHEQSISTISQRLAALPEKTASVLPPDFVVPS